MSGGQNCARDGDALARCAAACCPGVEVEAEGRRVRARCTRDELARFYLLLCSAMLGRLSGVKGARLLVGIAGPPGSGKSVLAALLARLLEAAAGRPVAAVVPMDGFHFPNAYLDTHFATGPDGTRVPLRALKGAPETFDVAGFAAALRALAGEEGDLSLPRYDRRLHDPVPDGIQVRREHRVALVEGNYLLLEREGWREVAALLDLKLFISMSLETARAGLIERHVRGGRTPEDAERHFLRVDAPNHRLCTTQRELADAVIERGADQRIASLTWRTGHSHF